MLPTVRADALCPKGREALEQLLYSYGSGLIDHLAHRTALSKSTLQEELDRFHGRSDAVLPTIPEATRCVYKFKRGNRQNETCGSQNRKGSVYCSKHSKVANEVKEPAAVIPFAEFKRDLVDMLIINPDDDDDDDDEEPVSTWESEDIDDSD